METNKKIILWIVVGAIIIAGGSFYGGVSYAKSKNSSAARAGFAAAAGTGANGQRTAGGRTTMAGFVAGQIISKDGTSITVSSQGGGSKIVFFSPTTAVSKTASSSVSDLDTNQQVIVTGTPNQDGSINAQSIQVGTGGMMGFRRPQTQ